MDPTELTNPASPDMIDIPEQLTALAETDPADAPEIGEALAEDLTGALDSVTGSTTQPALAEVADGDGPAAR